MSTGHGPWSLSRFTAMANEKADLPAAEDSTSSGSMSTLRVRRQNSYSVNRVSPRALPQKEPRNLHEQVFFACMIQDL